MFKELFKFDKMITPRVIEVIFALILIGITISTIVMFASDSVFSGILLFVFGAIGARIWCEITIVLFKIHECLQKIANKDDNNSDII